MTKERKIEILKDLLIQLSDSANILCTCEADERCDVIEEYIKELEQQSSEDCKGYIFSSTTSELSTSKDSWCDGDYENCDYRDNCSYADNCSECADFEMRGNENE